MCGKYMPLIKYKFTKEILKLNNIEPAEKLGVVYFSITDFCKLLKIFVFKNF